MILTFHAWNGAAKMTRDRKIVVVSKLNSYFQSLSLGECFSKVFYVAMALEVAVDGCASACFSVVVTLRMLLYDLMCIQNDFLRSDNNHSAKFQLLNYDPTAILAKSPYWNLLSMLNFASVRFNEALVSKCVYLCWINFRKHILRLNIMLHRFSHRPLQRKRITKRLSLNSLLLSPWL